MRGSLDLSTPILGPNRIAPMQQRFSGAPTFSTLGCVGDGETDNAAALAALPAGTPIIGNAGIYRLNSPWLLKSGMAIWKQPGCILTAPFNSSGQSAVVTQADIATPLTGVEMYGGTFKKDTTARYGRMFSLNLNDSIIENFVIDTYGGNNTNGGGAMFFVGNNLRVGYGRIINPAQNVGCAGIRYLGGTGARFYNLYVESGDQAFQAVPGASGINGNLDIVDCQFSQCNGVSYGAELIAAGQVVQGGADGSMTCSIAVTFDRITGAAGFRAIDADNQDSTGTLNITATNFDIDLASDPNVHAAVWTRGTYGPVTGLMSGIIRNALLHTVHKEGTDTVDTTGVVFV